MKSYHPFENKAGFGKHRGHCIDVLNVKPVLNRGVYLGDRSSGDDGLIVIWKCFTLSPRELLLIHDCLVSNLHTCTNSDLMDSNIPFS